MLKYILTICVCVVVASSIQLPSYIRQCSSTDQKLDKCLTKSANAAWPLLVRGDQTNGIQTMDPLFFSFLQFPFNEEFNGNMTNGIIAGLSEMKIEKIKLNLDKNILDIYFVVPRLYLYGPYKCAGKLVDFRMDGEGTFNTTWTDMQNHLHIKYELTEKKGKHYVEIKEHSLKYSTTRQYFYLTNLFNGDKKLGDKINKEINEKWELVDKVEKDTVENVFGNVYVEALQSFFDAVPFDDLFAH